MDNMSDNPADAAPVADDEATPPTDAPDDAPATETPPADAVEAPEGDAAAQPAAATEEKPDEPAKQAAPAFAKQVIARLSREKGDTQRELERTQRELAAYKALAGEKDAPADTTQPASARPDPEIVRQAARELIAEQESNRRRDALVAEGAKELGEAVWNEKTGIVATLGATDNPAFMQAIVEIPGGHRVVAALADDADALVSLLDLPPVAMAVKLGQMAAELNAAPKPKPLTSAPRPVAQVGGRAQALPSIYDTKNLSTEEWMALRNRTAPRHLGGEGKAR